MSESRMSGLGRLGKKIRHVSKLDMKAAVKMFMEAKIRKHGHEVLNDSFCSRSLNSCF